MSKARLVIFWWSGIFSDAAISYGVITYVDVFIFIAHNRHSILSPNLPLISIRGDLFSVELKGPANITIELIRDDVDFTCRLGRGRGCC